MNILFLHPNFPAQFKSPCNELAHKGHNIKFLCQTHNGRQIDGVEKLVLKGSGSHEKTVFSNSNEQDRMLYRAKAYREAFVLLQRTGWNPDVTIAHSGWGCGVHLKEIWPSTYFMSYLEWWFDIRSDLITNLKSNIYFQLNETSIQKLWIRNMPTSFEMCTANKIIAPTEWQKQQLPKLLQEHCSVIRDQINRKLFFPDPSQLSPSPVLTYGTRGMEPMRAFPQFIQILPKLLRKWPQLKVEVAGSDTISYGGILPKEKSWKKWALNFIQKENIDQQVKWIGQMPLESYANWLKKTWCHVYLSEPFVTSWSFIEAQHCQVPMVASATNATLEFKSLNPNLTLVNHNNQAELLEAINDKIRIFAKSGNKAHDQAGSMQIKNGIIASNNASSLVALIADVEAATKV